MWARVLRGSPILIFFFLGCSFFNRAAGITEDNQCEPALADSCFTDVVQDLRCLVSSKRKSQCNDLCKSIDDGLQCIADIIDNDCSKKDGRERFDSWLRGLRAVYFSLCGTDRTTILGLTQNADCWNPLSFVSCVEKMAGIEHVNDLLRLKLDMNQCNRLMISITSCNVKATSLGTSSRCTPSLEGVNEIIHSFFSKTECGRTCGNHGIKALPNLVVILVIALLKYIAII